MSETLDIILPAFNPSENWEAKVYQSYNEIKTHLDIPVGLIIINDGSTENFNSANIKNIKNLIESAEVLEYNPNQGKGYALRKGISYSKSKFIIYTDIDFPYLTESIISIYNSLKNCDVALGFREDDYYDDNPWFRKVLSKSFRWFLKEILNLKITDTQCGLKGFNNNGKEIFLKTKINKFLVDLEFVMLLSKSKTVHIQAVSVKLRQGVIFSKMGFKVIRNEFTNLLRLIFSTPNRRTN